MRVFAHSLNLRQSSSNTPQRKDKNRDEDFSVPKKGGVEASLDNNVITAILAARGGSVSRTSACSPRQHGCMQKANLGGFG